MFTCISLGFNMYYFNALLTEESRVRKSLESLTVYNTIYFLKGY